MIKVLIVDDDKLVRKGISSAMPWKEFSMEVVGEASNGAKALDFLKTQPVDLMLTDLAMPVMSGIELMRAARQLYPELHIVVLTLHQDFDYIQEALRLGAIDYIAKVQLEKEQFEHVLQRIHTRINGLTNTIRKMPSQNEINVHYQHVYALVSQDRKSEHKWPMEITAHEDEVRWEVERNSCMWAVHPSKEDQLFHQLKESLHQVPHGTLLVLSDVQERTWSQIKNWIMNYTDTSLFYAYNPNNQVITVSMNEDNTCLKEPQDEEMDRIKQSWFQTPWTHHDSYYNQLIDQFISLRLHKGQLMGLLYSIVMEWNHLFAQTTLGRIAMIHSFESWYEVEAWIKQTAASIQKADEQTSYSQEIIDAVKKAVMIVQNDLEHPYTASGLSQQLNISRSYFSQCFKDLMGKTFNEYSRFIRVEKSKEYLLNTNNTIFWIAERVGYTDEKYFSRIFRELTGLLPSEYRQLGRGNK
ncbi:MULTISPECIES: response regulator [unclassified Paenibacillus]|uniref:response regulator n=1 Tax=unclassified Paenibacillus TaxID=185978 RepID=UPI000CFBF9F8|nr:MULTISPECIES: response regulator [unclassified Paenibacillus]MBD8837108.1 response regulator [Paenibacillus sp. CFBP 13594]PRA07648.1 DNA-binding response regulator [Paenibacillus sp. MYb63]PRA51293.1 DNA-binding response regulator [Paenibacillus sp. MYb67]QZN74414.1 response regulator [Paenibacillus sp. DR312]